MRHAGASPRVETLLKTGRSFGFSYETDFARNEVGRVTFAHVVTRVVDLGAAAVTFACASLLCTHVVAMNSPAAKVYESLIPIAVVGLLEAYTQQIDNVVLPVVFSTLVLCL